MKRHDSAPSFWCGGKEGLTWGDVDFAVLFRSELDAEAVMRILKQKPEFANLDLAVESVVEPVVELPLEPWGMQKR
jgi:hypothetical protein